MRYYINCRDLTIDDFEGKVSSAGQSGFFKWEMIVKNFIFAALLLTAIILTGCKEKKPPQEQYKPDERYADTVKNVDKNEVKIAHPVYRMTHPTETEKSTVHVPLPVRRTISTPGYEYNTEALSASSGTSTSAKRIYVYKRPSFIRRYRDARPRPAIFKPHHKPSFASHYFRKPNRHQFNFSRGSFHRPKRDNIRNSKPKLNNFKKSKHKNSISKYKGK